MFCSDENPEDSTVPPRVQTIKQEKIDHSVTPSCTSRLFPVPRLQTIFV